MVRSKKNSSSKKSLKNMPQSQLNNPRRNVNNLGDHTANMNMQDYNIPNPATKLPGWNSSLTINEILNNYIRGQSPGNSLFTSSFDLSPRSNFLPSIESNYINTDNGIHTLLEQSNFPLINEYNISFATSNGRPRDNIGSQYSNTVPVGRPYAKGIKTSNSESSEFKMRNKDFPALPGTQVQKHNVANTPSTIVESTQQWSATNIGSKLLNNLNMDQIINKPSRTHLNTTDFHMNGFTVPEAGVQTSLENGKVSNIPGSMLRDQFGMIGQLITMRTIEKYPKLVGLTFGEDLTSLGMNLNSPENIYPTFAGPFENSPLGPQNIEFEVPSEYIINHKIKHKLAPIKLPVYKEDLLFYLFYTHIGDAIQMAVASELRTRGWRYHTEQHIWITPVSGPSMFEVNSKSDRGTFYVFDVELWRKVTKELSFNYTVLDAYVANGTVVPPIVIKK